MFKRFLKFLKSSSQLNQFDRDVYQIISSQFPISGLEIIDVLQLEPEYNNIEFGRLYPSLNRLEKYNYIESEMRFDFTDSDQTFFVEKLPSRRRYYFPVGKGMRLNSVCKSYIENPFKL